MYISLEIYNWLNNGIILGQENQYNNKIIEQKNLVQLDNKLVMNLELGLTFSQIIEQIVQRISTPKEPKFINTQKIKDIYNPVNKLQNWNLIANQFLPIIEINLMPIEKAQIVAGHQNSIINLLEKIYQKYYNKVAFVSSSMQNIGQNQSQNKKITSNNKSYISNPSNNSLINQNKPISNLSLSKQSQQQQQYTQLQQQQYTEQKQQQNQYQSKLNLLNKQFEQEQQDQLNEQYLFQEQQQKLESQHQKQQQLQKQPNIQLNNGSQKEYNIPLYMQDSIISQQIDIGNDEQENAQLDLNTLNPKKNIQQSSSLLEFFVLNICQNFKVKGPQEAINYLNNGGKIINNIQITGGKSKTFINIGNFLKQFTSNIFLINKFVQQDQDNLNYLLINLEGGLKSNNEEIAIISYQFFTLLTKKMAQIGLLFKIYNWIHSGNKLFQSILKTIQIHKQAQEQAFEFIVELSYEYYADTFVQKLKIALENNVYSYLKFVDQVFPIIYQNTLKKEKFYQSGTLDPLLKIILKSIENDQEAQQQQNEKQVALSLLIKIWINYTNFIEKYRIDHKIVDFIKRGCRSHSKPYRYQCYQYLFSLIHQFASQKNPKVQIIYKTLIFLIIENHQDLESREFFLRNFMEAIFRFPTMPIEILLEPYIKQIQISGGGVKSFINICDIEFIHCVITHRSLNLKLGLLFTDMMLKIYLNNFIWSNCLIGPIQILITKFLDHSLFQNFLLKIIGLSCNDILESYQQDKEQQQISNDIQEQIDNLQKQQQEQQKEQYEKDIVLSQIQQNESKEMLIQNAQRRALIIELLKFIINLKNYQINDKIKSIVGKVFMDLKDEKIPSKGILMLISLFGDPIKVLEKFQQHYSQGLLNDDLKFLPNNNLNQTQNNQKNEEDTINQQISYQQQQQNRNLMLQNLSQNNSDIFKQQNVSTEKSLNQSKKRLQTNQSQIVKKEKLKQELGLSPSKEHKSLYKNEFIQNNQNQENVVEKNVFDVDYGIDESLAVLNMQKPNSSLNDNNLKLNNSQNVQQIRQSSRQSKPKSQQQYEQQQLYDTNILNQDESYENQNYQSHRQIPRLKNLQNQNKQKSNQISLPQLKPYNGDNNKNKNKINYDYIPDPYERQFNKNQQVKQQKRTKSVNNNQFYGSNNSNNSSFQQNKFFNSGNQSKFQDNQNTINQGGYSRYQNYLPNPQERKFNINSLKSDQADLKSINYMKQKKLKEQDQRLEKQMELVNKQLQMQKLQNKAANQIAIKNLVNNVAKEGIFNYQPQVVFEENTLDPQILNQTEKNNQIILFTFKEAEIRDQNAITVNLNRYKEGIKYLFKKYHFITDPKANIRNNYNQSILTKKQDKISFADVWRLCKDNDFSVLVSKEEIHQLVKLTNATFGIKSGDIYSLDLESFPAFLIQLAYLSFSREPRDFRGQHMGVIIQAFFNLAVQAMIRRNENPAIIQEPEILNIRGDPEVIRSYNEKLRIDPQIPIPDNYKKYKEQEFGTYYIINDKLKQFIPESQLICYEIINDLVYEVIGSNIIEPVTQIEINVKIKPKPIPIGQKQRNLNQNKQQRLEQNNQIYEIQPKDTISDHRMPNPLQNGKPKNKYNVQSRLKNQSQPPNAQKQDPEWLQQMKKPQKKILNKAMREKMEKQQQEEEEKQKKNLNMLQRKHELKNELEEKYKEKLEFGKKKYQELEEINRQKQEMELKKQEQERIRQQENKQKLRQYKEQKDEQKKQEQEEYMNALQQYEQEKKEYNDMYIKQKNEEYKSQFQNLQQQRKEQKLQQKQEEYNQKLKEKKFDLQFEDFMKQQKQEHEQFKYMQQQLENLEKSAEIQQTYKRYDLVLKSLYNFYLQDSDVKITNSSQKLLSYTGFMHFITHFSINLIIQQEVVSSMFNYQTKEKTSSSKGLTFKEFRYLFLKMAVMGNTIWELIYTNFQNIDIQNEGYDYHDQDEMPNQQVKLFNPNLENIILPMNNEDVESTSPNALLGLIYFLRIPLISKSQINEKLREIKNNKSNNTDPYKRKKDTLQFLELNNLKMDQAQLDNNTSMQSQAQQNINAFQYVIQDEQAQEYKKLMQIREQKKNLFRK